jgi:HD-GYP domain-containing protein (c-di-GMP phosphodiesterase class II)
MAEHTGIALVIYFLEEITEIKTVQKLAAMENCGVFPIVPGGGGDITLILLQKTDIRDVEQLPINYEVVLVKVEKILIRLHMHARIIESNRDNREFFLRILRVMAKLLEERDKYTEHHSENVAKIACAIARRFGFSESEIKKLEMAGLLHDFGKIGISDQILNKQSSLTDEEYEIIKTHPSIAQAILEPVHNMEEIIPWIKYHHEKWDGSGYPDGISRRDIPLAARILAVADAYDTMHSRRTYHEPFDDEYILNELIDNKGRQFDPDVVDTFLLILQDQELDILA